MLNLLASLLCIGFAAEAPFWKAKPKIYDRIQNGEVIVSVTSQEESKTSPRNHMRMNGGGHVAAPCDFVYEEAQRYEEMASLSGFVKDAKYDPATHILEFTITAFFHSSTTKTKVEAISEPKPPRVDSLLVSGPMKGLHYTLALTPLDAKKCEVALSGDYNYDEFPIHRLFLQFGLEAVFQSMAERLRTHVEDDYRKLKLKTAPVSP